MKKGIVSALLTSAVVGAILGGFFIFWRKTEADRVAANPILSLGDLENKGLPEIQTQTISGAQFDLQNFKDKIVLVNFWASWCAPCIDEFPSMLKLLAEFPNEMVLVAVSRDRTQEDIETFLKAFPGIQRPNIHVIWDKQGTIAKAYGIDRLPESFLAKKGLKLSRKIIGSIPWHTNDSTEFIRSLLNQQ